MASKYDVLRQRAQQSLGAQQQTEGDALKRRYAAMGMGGSGAAIKSEMLSNESSRDRLAQSNENIGFQEAAESERKDEMEGQRKFAREERMGSQDFSRGERLGSEKFAGGESALARRFANEQGAIGRKFQTSERLGAETFGSKEADLARKQQDAQFTKQLTQMTSQFTETMKRDWDKFVEEKRVNNFNMDLADRMANDKGILGKMTPSGDYYSDAWKGVSGGRSVGLPKPPGVVNRDPFNPFEG